MPGMTKVMLLLSTTTLCSVDAFLTPLDVQRTFALRIATLPLLTLGLVFPMVDPMRRWLGEPMCKPKC